MSNNNKKKKNGIEKHDDWYDIEIVVEILIHETPRGQRHAPEIGNLCIGFTSLTLEKLREEIDDLRIHWSFVFPRDLTTKELLKLIRKKYPAYEELLALRDME